MLKVYPSSMSFAAWGINAPPGNGQCWRYIFLAQGARSKIDPKYQELGALGEDVVAEKYIGVPFEKEVAFKTSLGEGVELSGRCDFLTDAAVIEVKSTTNRRVLTDALRNKPKPQHLAQLVLYMGHFNKSEGLLCYVYFEQDEAGKLVEETSVRLKVTLEGKQVHVNGAETEYSVNDLVDSITECTNFLLKDELPPRPIGYDRRFGPCEWCPLKTACDTNKVNREIAKQLIETQQPVAFKVNPLKQRRAKNEPGNSNASVQLPEQATAKPARVRRAGGTKERAQGAGRRKPSNRGRGSKGRVPERPDVV